jgi:hypothetical protein
MSRFLKQKKIHRRDAEAAEAEKKFEIPPSPLKRGKGKSRKPALEC